MRGVVLACPRTVRNEQLMEVALDEVAGIVDDSM